MIRARDLLVLLALLGGSLGASSALAEPTIIPVFGRGFIDDGELRSLVGSLSYSLESCNRNRSKFDRGGGRTVTVRLSRRPADFEQRGPVVDTVLRKAAQFAWRNCPYRRYYMDIPLDDFYYDLDQVVIRGPGGEGLISASLGGGGMDGYGDQVVGSSGRGYIWKRFQDLYAQAREAEARIRAQEARAAAAEQARLAEAERERRLAAKFWTWVRILLVLGLAAWAWFNRVALIKWYYRLTPHPAEAAMYEAFQAGVPLDGAAYARLVETPDAGPIETMVRAEQARELAEQWRFREAIVTAETEEILQQERTRLKEEGEILDAQRQLIEAAIAHEKAAARLAALKPSEKTP